MYETGPVTQGNAHEQGAQALEPELVSVAERLYQVDAGVREMTANVVAELLRESHLDSWAADKPLPPAALRGIQAKVADAVRAGAIERKSLKTRGASETDIARAENIVMAHVNALQMLERRGK